MSIAREDVAIVFIAITVLSSFEAESHNLASGGGRLQGGKQREIPPLQRPLRADFALGP
jgi:hypothetical protein